MTFVLKVAALGGVLPALLSGYHGVLDGPQATGMVLRPPAEREVEGDS